MMGEDVAERLTEEVLQELLDAPSLDEFIDAHEFPAVTLPEFLERMLEKKGLKRSRVVRMADLNETFGYQIFTGARNPSRDKVLQIAFAMALSLRETNRALVAAIGAGSKTAELVMPGLCDAVAMLHESFDPPLIHRDLKPSNVLMCGGAPVIIDFGSARQWREGADVDTTHFITRRYAPPEQFGFGQTDVRSDVYALGKLLYFCLVGEDPPNVCDRQACERADLSPKACEVVCRACAFDPDARYRSAREVRRALLDALGPSGGGGRAPIGTGTPEHARDFAWDLPGDIASNSHPAAVAKEHEASARTSSAGRPSIAGRSPMSPLWWNSLRARWERFALRFERPLRWVSVLWNGWIYCGFSVFFIGSVNAIVSPNAHDALLPLWFRVIEYVGVGMVSMGSLCYLMLYKARIYARVPVLARLGRVKESAWAIALFAMGIAVPLVVGMISGLL